MFFRRVALGALMMALIAPLAPAMAADVDSATATDAGPKPEIKKFGSWAMRCDTNPKNAKQKECHAFVDVRIGEDGKQRVLYVGVGYIPKKTDGSMFMFAITPLGTILPAGLGVDIDNSGKAKFGGQYIFCVPLGCQAEMPITAENLKALKGAKEMEVAFKHAGKGDIKVPVKLDGFSAAIGALPKQKG